MGFRLLPNKVYATQSTQIGMVIIQAVNGNAELYGSNITHYKNDEGKMRLIIPTFDKLLPIWDDILLENTFTPMTCLTSFIGFKTKEEGTELWLNMGIDERLTPCFEIDEIR